jgi:alpha-D-xyloside xylohydrolase
LYNTLQFKHFNSKPDGGVNFSRGGGIGAQRYPFVWAGDQRREFYFLKPVVRAALSLGLSGVPFVSWDMAGYQPSFNPIDKRQENRVFIRGLEFTAFSPVIQTHGRIKRPYDFDDHTKDVYRAYSNLHECLKPYLIEQAEISCKTGLPLMRHLFLYDSNDKNCFDIEDEYMLGEALLVAPVLSRFNHRNIYLPKGRWVNIFDGREYEGGRWLKHYKVPLESVPVFRLAGAASGCIDDVLENAKPFINEIDSYN